MIENNGQGNTIEKSRPPSLSSILCKYPFGTNIKVEGLEVFDSYIHKPRASRQKRRRKWFSCDSVGAE